MIDQKTLELLTSSAPADPTYGYSREELFRIGAPHPPDDFDLFWRAVYEDARSVITDVRITSAAFAIGDREVHEVEFNSLDGVRIGGWISVPSGRAPKRGLVVGHGYAGRDAPDGDVLLDEAAALFFCSRGVPTRSCFAEIPPIPHKHVLHGIARRDTYVLRGCVADVWCAVSALRDLVPEAASIGYVGPSFSGGVGALALPWDDRIGIAWLEVPSFGNHPLRLTLQCVGSGASLRWYSQRHPDVVEVLKYFDAATAATFVRTPTHVALALADPSVPPPGQFAIYNSLRGPKGLFLLTAGHFEYPEMADEAVELRASQRAFASMFDSSGSTA